MATIDFDQLFDKAKAVANAASKRTGEVLEIGRLRLQSSSIMADIDKAYQKLGNIVYDMAKADSCTSNLIDACVAEIDALYDQYAQTEDKIAEAKHTVRCRVCGANAPESSLYCPRCGSCLIVPPQEEEACEGDETCPEKEAAPCEEASEPQAADEPQEAGEPQEDTEAEENPENRAE